MEPGSIAQPRKRCRHCGRELTAHEAYAGGVCGAADCRRLALEAELIDFRAHALQLLGESSAEPIPIAVVPHRAGRMVPLAQQLKSEFAQHIHEMALCLASQNGSAPDRGSNGDADQPLPSSDPIAARLAAAVCSACAGFCCYPGAANAAFIEVSTLQRYAAEHPGACPEAIVAAYLDHLPERHYEGSCVYHTASGCRLPRDMRSATCNTYACKGLSDALATAASERPCRRFVVARHDNRIVRGVLIDETGSRETPDCSLGNRGFD